MPLVPFWPALIFWPAIVVGLVAAGVGLLRQRPPLLIGGALLMLPASLYLTATPRFQYVGWVPVACVLLAAYAVRRGRVWIGGVLLAGGIVFWSMVASMLAFPILLHVLVGGAAIGAVAARPFGWKALAYAVVGIVGAFIGALLSFGDAPFLMRHPSLNPWTLSIVAAVLLVTALRLAEKRIRGR